MIKQLSVCSGVLTTAGTVPVHFRAFFCGTVGLTRVIHRSISELHGALQSEIGRDLGTAADEPVPHATFGETIRPRYDLRLFSVSPHSEQHKSSIRRLDVELTPPVGAQSSVAHVNARQPVAAISHRDLNSFVLQLRQPAALHFSHACSISAWLRGYSNYVSAYGRSMQYGDGDRNHRRTQDSMSVEDSPDGRTALDFNDESRRGGYYGRHGHGEGGGGWVKYTQQSKRNWKASRDWDSRDGGGGGTGTRAADGAPPERRWRRQEAVQPQQPAQQQQQHGWRGQQPRGGGRGNDGVDSALLMLRTAESWRELQWALDTVPAWLRPSSHTVLAAVMAYCRLVKGDGGRGAPQTPPEAAPAQVCRQHRDGGGGEPPPPGLKERLRAELLAAAPALTLSELSMCLFSIATLPRTHRLMAGDTASQDLSDALLGCLERHMYDIASRLKAFYHSKDRRRDAGGAAAAGTAAKAAQGGSGGEGDLQFEAEAECLTYLCTAVRQLRIARPSVHRALAAAAAPMLGRELAGEALPPLALGFLEAGNPEPLFLEELVRHSSLPYSLAQTRTLYAGTILLRAAGMIGAGTSVVGPLEARITEILRPALKRYHRRCRQQQQEQLKKEKKEAAAAAGANTSAGGCAGAIAGGSTSAAAGLQSEMASSGVKKLPGLATSGAAAPAPQEQQQQQHRRLTQDDTGLTYILEACAVARLGRDSTLVQLLVEEIKQRQIGWDVMHRLMTARSLNMLGFNVVEAMSPPPAAQAVTTDQPQQSRLVDQQLAQQQEQGQAQSLQQDQGAAASPPAPPAPPQQTPSSVPVAPSPDWVMVREEEVMTLLLSENVTLKLLLPTLHALSQLCVRADTRASGSAAAVVASAVMDDSAYDAESAAAEAVAPARHMGGGGFHPNRMATALGVAVQLTNAAAPLMAPRQVGQAVSSSAAAGQTMPPLLLQRAEQLYREQLASLSGGEVDNGGGGGDLRYEATAAARGDGADGHGDTDVACSAEFRRAGGGGGGSGHDRDVRFMCAVVGRVLAWQPGAAAAAMLSENFVRRCRDAALSKPRCGK